jgi:hypothetical protein
LVEALADACGLREVAHEVREAELERQQWAHGVVKVGGARKLEYSGNF